MKCLSIRQPWAWLIIQGHKDIENRGWRTHYRGPILVHASAYRPGEQELNDIEEKFGLIIPRNELVYGAVIGTTEITDCVTQHSSKWFMGTHGLVLTNSQPLKPMPAKGKLNLFEIEYKKTQ